MKLIKHTISNVTSNQNNVLIRSKGNIKRNNNIIRLERLALREHLRTINENQNEKKYPRFLNASESGESMRMISMTVIGCNLKNKDKIKMLQESIKRFQIDIALFNEVKTK